MGNSSSQSRPSAYLENIGSQVEKAESELIDNTRLFLNAAVVSALAYSDDPNEMLSRLTGVDHDITVAQKCVFRGDASIADQQQQQHYIVATNREEDVVFVGLRGTRGSHIGDWSRNLNLMPVDVDGGRIHSGFRQCAKEVHTHVLSELIAQDKKKKIVITGHSKGGAVATALLLLMLTSPLHFHVPEIKDRVMCVAFAAPLLADQHMAEYVKSNSWGHLFHSIVNDGDIVPVAFTIFFEQLLSSPPSHGSKYEQFSQIVGRAIDEGAKAVLTSAGVPPTIARAAVQLVQGCTRLMAETGKNNEVIPPHSFYPFGHFYHLRPRGQGLAAITNCSMVSDLLYPLSISEVVEQNVVNHLLNAYLICLRIGSGPPKLDRPPFLSDQIGRFLVVSAGRITVTRVTHTMSEIRITLSGQNLRMIQSLQYRPLGITSFPSTAEEGAVAGNVSFSFSSGIVGSSAAVSEIVFVATCYFNEEVRVTVKLPSVEKMSQEMPSAWHASKSMDSVVESSLYRCMILARAAAITGGGLFSPAHIQYFQEVLADLDGLCQLTDFDEFLEFSHPVQVVLEDDAFSLPMKEGEEAIRNTCRIIVDLVNSALDDHSYKDAILNPDSQEHLFNVELVAGEGRGLKDPLQFSGLSLVSNVNVFPNSSSFLPSKLYEHLFSISGDSSKVWERIRVVLAFCISKVGSKSVAVNDYTPRKMVVGLLAAILAAGVTGTFILPALTVLSVVAPSSERDLPPDTLWQSVFKRDSRYCAGFDPNACVKLIQGFLGIMRVDKMWSLYNTDRLKFSSVMDMCAHFLLDVGYPAPYNDPFILETKMYGKFVELFGEAALSYDLPTARVDVFMWNSLRSVCRIYRLRCSLQKAFFLAVIGTGNLGKSRLIADLFGVDSMYGGGARNRTMQLTSFTCRQPTTSGSGTSRPLDNFFVLDFPGNDHVQAELTKGMFRQGLATLDVVIIMLEGKQARLEGAIKVIKEVHDKKVVVPMLICLNRADEWAATLATDADESCNVETFKAEIRRSIADFRESCAQKKIHLEYLDNFAKIVPTCFDMRIKSQLRCLVDS
eukprot:gene26185-34249_t